MKIIAYKFYTSLEMLLIYFITNNKNSYITVMLFWQSVCGKYVYITQKGCVSAVG